MHLELSPKQAASPPVALPLVSVVMAVRNRERLVPRAIRSVVAQTWPSIELVVVDDASDDGTAQAVATAAGDLPLTLVRLPIRQGAPIARNHGIAAARGEFVALLDSDDYWHPEKLRLQVERLRSAGPGYGLCYTMVEHRCDAGTLLSLSRDRADGDLSRALLQWNVVGSTSSVLVRRDLLVEIGGFRPDLPACQDWDLWVRAAQSTRTACVAEPLTTLVLSPQGRITNNLRHRLRGHLFMWRTHIRPRRDEIDASLFLRMVAEILMRSGRPRAARRLMVGSWLGKPWSAQRAILLLGTLPAHPGLFDRVSILSERLEARVRRAARRWMPATTPSGRLP